MGRRDGRRTVTSALALITVSLLALAGNEIAHAGSTSSPYPQAESLAQAVPAPDAAPVPEASAYSAPSGGGASQPTAGLSGAAARPEGTATGSGSPSGPVPTVAGGTAARAPVATAADAQAPAPKDSDAAGPKGSDAKNATPEDPAPTDPSQKDPSQKDPAPTDPAQDDPDPDAPDAKTPTVDPEAKTPVTDPDPTDAKNPDAKDPGATDPTAADEPAADEPGQGAGPAAKAGATTAAQRFGWGTPLPGSDEFDYTGSPNPAKWNQAGECWAGHAGNGGRCASKSTVDGSKLVQTGLANGDSAWVASKTSQRYGRWEARVRSKATGPNNGRQYHPLLIVWPSSNRWPQDGEYDFLENGAPGQQCAESFIHYPHGPGAVQQEFVKEKDCGAPLTEWHNVAFEWTPQHVRGYIDGKKWFDFSGGSGGSRRNIQDMPAGHLTIQLDNFFGGNMQPAVYEIDWVRIYGLR